MKLQKEYKGGVGRNLDDIVMKVTHIGHSGFLVELETMYLLFDYYQGEIPILQEEKELYVFVSHGHHDHFNIRIFEWFQKRNQVAFILSRDVRKTFGKIFFLRHGIEERIWERIHFVLARKHYEIHNIKVDTYLSTDAGVAFSVSAEGKEIYHAGDLNWWTWEEETRENNDHMIRKYCEEIDRMEGHHFDLAFVVLDSRQASDFYKGFDYFMKKTDTDLVYPMHYWEDSSVIQKIKVMDLAKSYREKIMES